LCGFVLADNHPADGLQPTTTTTIEASAKRAQMVRWPSPIAQPVSGAAKLTTRPLAADPARSRIRRLPRRTAFVSQPVYPITHAVLGSKSPAPIPLLTNSHRRACKHRALITARSHLLFACHRYNLATVANGECTFVWYFYSADFDCALRLTCDA
jgi:hypothetical protein